MSNVLPLTTMIPPFKVIGSSLVKVSIKGILYQALDASGSVCIPQFFTYRGTYSNFYTKYVDVGVSSLSKKRFFEGLLEKRVNTTKSLSNLHDSGANLYGFCIPFRRDVQIFL